MHDIRHDLRERLNAIVSQQGKLREEIAALENQSQLLMTLLRKEQLRWEESNSEIKDNPTKAENGNQNDHKTEQLFDIISELLNSGEPWYSSQLARVASQRGYQFGQRQPGRAVHFTLLGMAKRGEVKNVGLGRWKKVE